VLVHNGRALGDELPHGGVVHTAVPECAHHALIAALLLQLFFFSGGLAVRRHGGEPHHVDGEERQVTGILGMRTPVVRPEHRLAGLRRHLDRQIDDMLAGVRTGPAHQVAPDGRRHFHLMTTDDAGPPMIMSVAVLLGTRHHQEAAKKHGGQ
jgi:hypothetical protein